VDAPPRPCLVCGQRAVRAGRCRRHYAQSERRRGTAYQRGYGREHQQRFRAEVLRRDALCVLCGAPATVADHWPRSRRALERAGDDPNDPRFGRGLCVSCHNAHTRRCAR